MRCAGMVTSLSCAVHSVATMHIDLELPMASVALDTVWVRACAGHLTMLDKLLDRADAECIAVEMSQHDHWREMPPGLAAASVMFEFADSRKG